MARLSYHHPEAPVFPRLSGLLSQVKYLSAHESLSFIPSTQASCYITIRRLLSFLFAESGVKKWIDYQVQFSQFKNHDRCPKFTHKGIFFLLRRVEGGAWHFQNRTRKYQLQNTSHSHTRKGAEFNFFVHFSFSVLPMSKAFGNFFCLIRIVGLDPQNCSLPVPVFHPFFCGQLLYRAIAFILFY